MPQACEGLVGEWRAGTIERLGARGRGTRQGPIDLEAFQGVQMENARWGRGKILLTFYFYFFPFPKLSQQRQRWV